MVRKVAIWLVLTLWPLTILSMRSLIAAMLLIPVAVISSNSSSIKAKPVVMTRLA